MAIIKKEYRKTVIDLTGPVGNAFALLATAKNLCKQLERDSTDILIRMKSGNYENLIKVFDEEFGEYVDLMR